MASNAIRATTNNIYNQARSIARGAGNASLQGIQNLMGLSDSAEQLSLQVLYDTTAQSMNKKFLINDIFETLKDGESLARRV